MPQMPRRLTALLALAALAALGLSCEDRDKGTGPLLPPPEVGLLRGSVYQRLHPEVPLAGATITWGGASATSAADGSYQLDPEEAGADSLRVNLAGFAGESRWVVLGETDQQQSFTLLPYDVTPPPAPLAFAVHSEGGRFLRLVWSAPADSSDLAGYWVTKSPGDPQAQRFDISVNEWLDIAVTPEREYSYSLASQDASGNLSAPLAATAALDALPTPLRLEFLSTADYGQIPLRWRASPDADFAAYRLYRAEGTLGADSLDLLVHTGSDPADTLFTDADVSANAVYSYRLYSYDAVGQAGSSLGLSQALGAAQRFFGADPLLKRLLLLPAGDRFLVSYATFGRLLLVDDAGAVQDSLLLDAAPTLLEALPDGRVWTAASAGGFGAQLTLVQSDPLALLREGTVDFVPGAFAWLGGDSLVLAPVQGGAPVLVDGQSFAPLDTLEFLADLALASRMTANPETKQLFIAETTGGMRLLRVDLSGAPALSETVDLPGFAVTLQRDGAGGLLLAFVSSSLLLRVAEVDLDASESIALGTLPSLGRFSEDGSEIWLRDTGSDRVRGYGLDWGAAAATQIAVFGQVDSPLAVGRLAGGGRVAALLDRYWVSLCDPARGD
ncbi:hypothetical protein FJ251_05220 [bacterium]|nr:hypothetical protein [bacterium]